MAVTDTLDADDQSAPGTMTKSELIAKLAERFPQLVAKDAEYAVRTILADRHRIEIRGFGTFALSHRHSRMGRNPKSGEPVPVPEKLVPHFKPGKQLRESVDRALHATAS